LVAKRARRRVATRAGRRRVKITPIRGVEVTLTASRVEVDPDVLVPFGERTNCATRRI
jgi:hypothetical protein